MERTLKFITGILGLIKPIKRDEPHPTIRFHTTHGSNIFLDESRSSVSRLLSYDNGIVFSDRPIELNEVVPIKISEIRKYRGPLFFGLTAIDPGTLRPDELRMIRSPDYRIYGVWLKGLHQHEMESNMTLCFRVLRNGVVKYSVNGIDYDTRLRGLETNVPMWAIFDVYGSVGGIKLVDLPVRNVIDEHNQSISNILQQQDNELPEIFIFPPIETTAVFPSSSTPIRNSPHSFSSNYEHRMSSSPRTPNNSPTSDCSDLSGFRTPASPTVDYQNKECIICIENDATTAFVKCGHMCLCYECASRFLDSSEIGLRRKIHSCPVCRAPVFDILRVYLS